MLDGLIRNGPAKSKPDICTHAVKVYKSQNRKRHVGEEHLRVTGATYIIDCIRDGLIQADPNRKMYRITKAGREFHKDHRALLA